MCDIKAQVCMMKRCAKCPGINSLRPHILDIIGDRRVIKYKMWVFTDRSLLDHKESSASVFVDSLTKNWLLNIASFCIKTTNNILPRIKAKCISKRMSSKVIFLRPIQCLFKNHIINIIFFQPCGSSHNSPIPASQYKNY